MIEADPTDGYDEWTGRQTLWPGPPLFQHRCFSDMSLQIECENGHKLICPDSLAGQSVVCPKCGSRLDVSARNLARRGYSISQAAVAPVGNVGKQRGDTAHTTGPRPTTSEGAAPAELTFYCPNGHRLAGPWTLQGQAGECPKCKAKFRIPVAEDPSDTAADLAGETVIRRSESVLEPEIPVMEADDDISLDEIAQPATATPIDRRAGQAGASTSVPHGSAIEGSPNSLAHLFALLWSEREHGGTVELHLEGGTAIRPDWWSTRLSNASYGLFACQRDDGKYEIQAIAWAHVRHITVRGLNELPGDVFEGT